MATGAQTWSTAAASNNSADGSVNWAEGMAPSAVNNSARAEMASVAMWIKDNSGTLLTSGSTAAYTVTSKQVSTAVVDGYTIAVNFHAANDASATLNVDGVGAKAIQLIPGTNLSTGDIVAGASHRLHYSSSSTAWIIEGANAIGASAVSSANIADDAVGLSKIANISNGTILGNGSGGALSPYEITMGSGITLSTGSISAPAYPPTSAYKRLVLKVTGNSSATLTADFVTLATSGSSNFITLPTSAEINFGTNGAANALDAGALAANTPYAIYAIAVSATSTHADGLASTSFTTPEMPATYTYKARVGALVTSTSTSGTLMGTWQYGNEAQYVVGLAATSKSVIMSSGVQGTYDASSPTLATQSTTRFVPSSASHINVYVMQTIGNFAGSAIIVAPNDSYDGTNNGPKGSNQMAWPIYVNATADGGAGSASLLLESSNIYWASSANGAALVCLGWKDNI